MRRDLDLARQLLIEIEGRGPDCALADLRPGVAGEADERIRYHIRLLVDGGLLKETEHTAGGVPCVRLTNAGHELLELSAVEARWREAKWLVQERTGTQSLTVLKSVLTRWAVDAAAYGERLRPRRYYRPSISREIGHRLEARSPGYAPYEARRVEPRYYTPRYETLRYDDRNRGDGEKFDDSLRLARSTDYLERFDWWGDWRDRRDREMYYTRDHYLRGEWDSIDAGGDVLPTYVV